MYPSCKIDAKEVNTIINVLILTGSVESIRFYTLANHLLVIEINQLLLAIRDVNMFAIVELKHCAKNYFIVSTLCLQNLGTKFKPTEDFTCYISPNDKPNFDDAEYHRYYSNSPGLFKVFIVAIVGKLNMCRSF